MSNVLGKSPWIIDTASATPLTTKPITLRELRLVGVATNACIVKDASGHEIYASTIPTGGTSTSSASEEGMNTPDWARGLAVTTLSGKLYIYYQ